jgi:hypothetical protein
MRMPRKRCPQDEERWARCVPTRPKSRCAEREKIDERTTRCFPSSLIRKNILVRTSPKSLHKPRRLVLSKRGGSRSSRTLGAGCGGHERALDETCGRGRRSRVVLTPRRWRSSLRKKIFRRRR